MRSETNTPFLCVCGSEAPLVQSGSGAAISEATCRCGRKYQVDLLGADRVVVSEPITPEPRQPLSGFSRELKANEDSQRFYFSHVVTRGHRLPVHILFSPSARQAEVATGDMKPMRFDAVDSVVDARRRWIAWFESLRTKAQRPSGAVATLARESRITS